MIDPWAKVVTEDWVDERTRRAVNRERVRVDDEAKLAAETGDAPTPERPGVAGLHGRVSRQEIARVLGSQFESVQVGEITVVKSDRYDDRTLHEILSRGVPVGIMHPRDAGLIVGG